MDNNKSKGAIVGWISIILLCTLVIFIAIYAKYAESRKNQLKIKSRYTFTVDINKDIEWITGAQQKEATLANLDEAYDFSDVEITDVANVWIKKFLEQFTVSYVPVNKKLMRVETKNASYLDKNNGTVLVSFSADLISTESEYFSSWGGVVSDGRLSCDWVMRFVLDNHGNNTATVYVSEILSSEAYGLSKYNESQAANALAEKEKTSNASGNSIVNYVIRNGAVSITFDGQKYLNVPVGLSNFKYVENSNSSILKDDAYYMSPSKVAFLYGGLATGNNRVPLSIIYSDDKGNNWTTCEIDNIYDASEYYVDFVDDKKGFIVCCYGKVEQSSMKTTIYSTVDGGATWKKVGDGPSNNLMTGVMLLDENIGFIAFENSQGVSENLYRTKDGWKTFSVVELEEQKLDSTAANSGVLDTPLTWKDVYKEALVPVKNSDDSLVVYLTQGKNGKYNDGKTVAKYQSTDKGVTWKYLGQLEMTTIQK